MKNKNILVTGGAGFIGINLCKRLIKDNTVYVLDKVRPKYGNWIKGDVTKTDWFAYLEKVDLIYHLAAIVGVDYVSIHPEETKNTEILGIKNIIKFAKQKKVNQVVYSSTSSVYEAKDKPTSYNTSKLKAEQILKNSGIKACILRFFNVYGPYQKEIMVVPRFIAKAKKDSDIIVFNDGNQTRDFTFVDDAIDAMIGVSSRDGIFDIGTGKETRLIDAAKLVKELLYSDSKIVFKEPEKNRLSYEVRHRRANPDLINSLGFACKTSLKEGILKTINNNI